MFFIDIYLIYHFTLKLLIYILQRINSWYNLGDYIFIYFLIYFWFINRYEDKKSFTVHLGFEPFIIKKVNM